MKRKKKILVAAQPTTVPVELTDASRGKRLQKVLAEAGVASRRDCEEMITAGRVTVNGQPVTALPAWVDERSDRVTVDGRPIRRPSRHPDPDRDYVYVLLNKPRNVVTTTSDPHSRRCVTDLVDLGRPVRLFPVGRLDADSTGLILLTNDGLLTQRLTHPRYGVPKRYVVSVRGRLNEEDFALLRKGLHLTDPRTESPPVHGGDRQRPPRMKRASVDRIRSLGFQRDRNAVERTKLEITLHEGQNRQIRRLLARLGYKVRRLQRVGIGSLTIKGLSVGSWRLLDRYEVRRLRGEVGLLRPEVQTANYDLRRKSNRPK